MTSRNMWIKRIAVAAGTAALVASATGVAAAHQNGAGSSQRGEQSSLIASGTMTQEQWTAVRDAMRAAMQSQRDSILADLVKKGDLTQDQADLLTRAKDQGTSGLAQSGNLDRATMQTVRDAMRTAHESREDVMSGVLRSLVAKGTITQTQADAINSAHTEREGARAEGSRQGKGDRGANDPRDGSGPHGHMHSSATAKA